MFREHPYLILSLGAFLVNIPMGYIRENCPKFSLRWLFWIHASIPLIIYARVTLGTSKWFIPVCISLAVAGQVVGGRRRRKTRSLEEEERLKQIPAIDARDPEKLDESRTTVVLLNMGGPRTNADVPDFQKRLFADPLLIRFPVSFLFQGLFARLLVAFRSKAARERYQLIGGGSPIFGSTERQAGALRDELARRGRKADVIFSFNYSAPFPEETISAVQRSGKKDVLLLSLYPHYSKATTGSNIYYLKKAAKQIDPEVQFTEAQAYYLHDGYIQAFVDRIHEQLKSGESLDDFYLIFSPHGLPVYSLVEGDPYAFQISQTVAKILTRIGRTARWSIAYQSAVGPLQWLKPSLEDMLEAVTRRGYKKLLIVPVAFVTDHIETLCEVDIEYRQLAGKLGAEDYRMSRAIECHPEFIRALADTVDAVLAPRAPDVRRSAQFAHEHIV
ncbi:MAG TPA: ferrochelatase [Candidatus Omnitrophica bacterium]|nr:ferrochelatase [Candidatus Omnitrophota bacterium]HCI44113.1 ferrochelatase [Candidatus Omnitrophota bacterium]